MKSNPPTTSKMSLIKSCAIAVAASAAMIYNASAGQLDLFNNAVILRGTDSTSQAANVAYCQANANVGYAGGLWTGQGIMSSTAAADALTLGVLGVMVVDNTQVGLDPFAGVSGLGPNFYQVLMKTTYAGDFDLNGVVDSLDYSLLDYYLGQPSPVFALGDLNADGVTDSLDYSVVDYVLGNQNYGPLSGGTTIDGNPPDPTPVPEPSTALFILPVAAAALIGWRRKLRRP